MKYFITLHTGLDPLTTASEQFTLPAWQKSLIVSVLSAGTFFGAVFAGDLSDWVGRRWTIISGCGIFMIGNILQTASSDGLGLVSLFFLAFCGSMLIIRSSLVV
jgi:MFS family permease